MHTFLQAPQSDYDVVALPESEKVSVYICSLSTKSCPEAPKSMTLFCTVQEQIKGLITGLMLSTPPVVRAQLSEALSIISEHDFPTRWQGLLPQLIDCLKTGDATTINGVLETLNSIYKRYRSQFMTGKLNEELKYSQQLIVPLWETLKGLSLQLQSNSADLTRTKQILSSIRLVCRIFYSLNSPGLTQVNTLKCIENSRLLESHELCLPFCTFNHFNQLSVLLQEMEDTLTRWFAEFHTFLVYDNPALADNDPDKESSIDAVKAAVCQNINLFMEMNEEEFKDYLQTFVQDVWTLLVAVKQGSGQVLPFSVFLISCKICTDAVSLKCCWTNCSRRHWLHLSSVMTSPACSCCQSPSDCISASYLG